jgi:hypothetical protein
LGSSAITANNKTKKEHEMKRITTLAAVTLIALTGAASAMVSHGSVTLSEIQGYAPGTDLSNLTSAQIGHIQSVIHGGDSEGEIAGFVKSVVRQSNAG